MLRIRSAAVAAGIVFVMTLIFVGWHCAADAAPSWIISGSPDGTASWSVDDALDIYVNGALAYTDGSNDAGTRQPVDLGNLKPGDSLKFQLRDNPGYYTSLSPLYLTCRPGAGVLAAVGLPTESEPPVNNQITYTSKFTVPALCQALSVTVNPIVISDDGKSFATATATMLDSDLNGLAGHRVRFSLTPGLARLISPSEQFTDANGNASVLILGGKKFGKLAIRVTDDAGDTAHTPLKLEPPPTGLPPFITKEDTKRRPGETDRDVLERFFKTAIQDGPWKGVTGLAGGPFGIPISVSSGLVDDGFAAISGGEKKPLPFIPQTWNVSMWENTCGGYVGQILTLFDNLRVNPLTEQYFDHLDYGPIQAELGGHHAVVLYDKGGDFRQGDELDPWPDQRLRFFHFRNGT